MSKHDTTKKGTRKEPSEVEAEIRKAAEVYAAEIAREDGSETASDGTPASEGGSIGSDGGNIVEIEALKTLADKKEAEAKENYERLTYLAAEFDNYRRRTQKEKERLFNDAVVDVAAAFLPVLDNLERAVKAAEAVESAEAVSLRDGVSMVARQCVEAMTKLGIREIAAQGAPFDPTYHNAVMHVEDESFGANEIVDVFQKGYLYKEDTVVRHAMVKVAN